MRFVFVCPESEEHRDSSEWRCHAPSRMINKTRRHFANTFTFREFITRASPAKEICERADVLVLHKNLWGKSLAAVQYWQARDKIVVADFEDAYQLMNGDEMNTFFESEGMNRVGENFNHPINSPRLAQFKWCLQNVNSATVPSKRLADDFRSYIQVEVLPDYIDIDTYTNLPQRKHEGINIGWRGRSTRLESLIQSGAIYGIKHVLASRPQVRLLLSVDNPNAVQGLGLPESRVDIRSWRDEPVWPALLAEFDIGLMPSGSEIDNRISWRQLLEFMAMKIPWIASRSMAYYDLRAYGWQIENSPESWKTTLMEVIDHIEEYRIEASVSPFLLAISQSLEENIYHIINTYARIADNHANGSGMEISMLTSQNNVKVMRHGN